MPPTRDPAKPGHFVRDIARPPARPFPPPDPDDDDHAEPPAAPRRAGLHLRVACAVEGLAIFGSLAAAFYEIRTVLVGGPVVFLAGVYLAAVGLAAGSRPGAASGFSSVAFTLFVFLLIGGLGWGPEKATAPVLAMGSCFATASAVLLAFAWRGPKVGESEEYERETKRREGSPYT